MSQIIRTLLVVAVLAVPTAAYVTGQDEKLKAPKFDPKQLHRLKEHTNDVMCVAFSADGKHMATASVDKTVRIWEVASGERTQYMANQAEAYCVAFSPDGKQVAVGSRGSAINIFDIESGDKCKSLTAKNSTALIAYSPDGKLLATVAVKGDTVQLWDLETGKPIHELKDRREVNGIVFTPDGKTLVSVCEALRDGSTIRVWDVAKGVETVSVQQDGNVHALAVSADGKTLLTGNDNGKIIRWDLTAKCRQIKPVLEFPKTNNGGLRRIGFLPGGRVWGNTWGGGNAVFDPMDNGKLLSVNLGFQGSIFYGLSGGHVYGPNHVALSPDGKTFAVRSGKETYLWDASKEFGSEAQ